MTMMTTAMDTPTVEHQPENHLTLVHNHQLIFSPEELPQGSAEWHEFRAKGIGGSEASALMGIGFSTINELWAVKTGRASGQIEMNDAMRRGHELEPVARAKYEETTGSGTMTPLCMVHPEFPFMRASLDGINDARDLILEIKCPGINTHTKAVRGKVPDYYIPQLQHQMLIAKALFGTENAHYYSYFPTDPLFALNSNSDGVLLEVFGDLEYQSELLKRGQLFWQCVENDTPPDPSDFRPYSNATVVERNDTQWKEASERYLELDAQAKAINDELMATGERLKHMADGVQADKVVGCGIEISKVERVGSVDYSSIPQLQGVNLEQFRKGKTSYLKIGRMRRETNE